MPLSAVQKAFATSLEPFPAFVGGFGSGKTAAGIARIMALKASFKDCDVAYYLPTYPLVEDIAFKRFPELCERKGWQYKINKQSSYIEFENAGRIIFRTMENPQRIVGYEVAHSLLDELDTLPIDKAREVWNKVIARNRQKCAIKNTVAVATTPEGFRFVYDRWVKNKKDGYKIFKACTMDNAHNLPEGYIENLQNTYSTNLLAAYLDGEFVNLTAGSVYADFDRLLNQSNEIIISGESLHIGLDFNVTKMAAVVHVLRGDNPHAVDELTGIFDTPAMINVIKSKYNGHKIFIYPDASGNNRKSQNASESDIALLKQAGFNIMVNPANPAVKDRVLAMNRLIKERKYLVNPQTCPELVESLERQAYDKNGDPDKTAGFDHVLDATGYCIAYRYPIRARTIQHIRMSGV
jgi:PBSX family phage terminase large subunit